MASTPITVAVLIFFTHSILMQWPLTGAALSGCPDGSCCWRFVLLAGPAAVLAPKLTVLDGFGVTLASLAAGAMCGWSSALAAHRIGLRARR
jgi:hypothetical protein